MLQEAPVRVGWSDLTPSWLLRGSSTNPGASLPSRLQLAARNHKVRFQVDSNSTSWSCEPRSPFPSVSLSLFKF